MLVLFLHGVLGPFSLCDHPRFSRLQLQDFAFLPAAAAGRLSPGCSCKPTKSPQPFTAFNCLCTVISAIVGQGFFVLRLIALLLSVFIAIEASKANSTTFSSIRAFCRALKGLPCEIEAY